MQDKGKKPSAWQIPLHPYLPQPLSPLIILYLPFTKSAKYFPTFSAHPGSKSLDHPLLYLIKAWSFLKLNSIVISAVKKKILFHIIINPSFLYASTSLDFYSWYSPQILY